MSSHTPTFLSLFSGCGGFDLGFEAAGFRGVKAFDICPVACGQFNNNLATQCEVADLSTETVSLGTVARPNVVICGSPCQGFSTLGKNSVSDPRNSLLIKGATIAAELRPDVVIMENVRGVLSGRMRSHWDAAQQYLQASGYSTHTRVITCSDFGVPQIRRRVFMIATTEGAPESLTLKKSYPEELAAALDGLSEVQNHLPKLLPKDAESRKIAIRIGQNQKLCNVRGGERAIPTWEIPEVFGSTTDAERDILRAIRKLRRQIRERATGDADPLKLSDILKHCGRASETKVHGLVRKGYLRKMGRRFDLTNTFNGKYRRLSNTELAPAVDTRFGSPCYILHPEEHRGVTAREAARIQGFPDDFTFDCSSAMQFRLIGNAVPPPVATAIAMALKEQVL